MRDWHRPVGPFFLLLFYLRPIFLFCLLLNKKEKFPRCLEHWTRSTVVCLPRRRFSVLLPPRALIIFHLLLHPHRHPFHLIIIIKILWTIRNHHASLKISTASAVGDPVTTIRDPAAPWTDIANPVRVWIIIRHAAPMAAGRYSHYHPGYLNVHFIL